MSRGRRLGTVLLTAAAWLVLSAAPAMADPPGPTDYRTDVVGFEPDTGGFRVEVAGGDSFVVLTVDPGVSVEVVGYRGEPYLRFLPDGTVEENQNSPTTYLNVDRYGIADVPARAHADAEPDWEVVATDGTYAWHDHRTHWMNKARPLGRSPGDVILEGVVPLVVEGAEVDVLFASTWQPAPSMAPVLAGMAAGLAVLMVAAMRRAGIGILSVIVLALAVPAAALGVVATLSVPAATSPPWSLWAPPLAATVLGAAAASGRWAARLRRWSGSAALLGALLLAVWGFVHREWMWRALLPTAAPFWLDRLVTGAVLVGAVGLVLLIGRAQVMGTAPPEPG